MNKEVDKYDENNKQIQPENNNYVDDSKDIIDNNKNKNDNNNNNNVVKQNNDNDNINSNNNTVNNTDNSDIDKNNDITKNNDTNNKKIEKIFISQKFEDDQEIVNNGIEVPNDSPSNFIKILKKDKHGEPLQNISYDYLFKVSLIGDSATGKTSIMLRFIDDFFTEDTKSTIGVDFKLVSLELANNIYAKMQIWDTCGSERFKSLTSSFIKTCSAFILVFDLTRVSTFKSIDNWIKIIKENTSPKFLILIGNKSDLVENRAIEKDIILDYCQKHLFNYFEISAKNNLNIEKMFKEVAYQLYMDIKKKEKNNVKSVGYAGNFSNIQVNMDNQKKKKTCCS
jgi:Ras-related protein Rab-1A